MHNVTPVVSQHPDWLPSAEEMARYDLETIAGGTTATQLMLRAGQAIAERILLHPRYRGNATVLCGPGNNGGDGYVVAHQLRSAGGAVSLFALPSKNESPARQSSREQFLAAGGKELPLDNLNPSTITGDGCFIVDALLGIGQTGPARGPVADAITKCQLLRSEKGAYICSVDIPSGIDATSGALFSPSITADITYTIEFLKRGMLQWPARDACGMIERVPIGIIGSTPPQFRQLTEESAPYPPKRQPHAHKGSSGHVFVIGGCRSMPGAAVLSAHAALSVGAGVVSAVRGPGPAEQWPEIIAVPVEWSSGTLGVASISTIAAHANTASSLVIGPGLGQAPSDFFWRLFDRLFADPRPTVIDASALEHFSVWRRENRGALPIVVTPHPGEAARMLGLTPAFIQQDRYQHAHDLAVNLGVVVVLKGASSIVYETNRGLVAPEPAPILATAGSGDVLAGICAAFLAQGLSPAAAAAASVRAHLTAAVRRTHLQSIARASEIIAELPSVLGGLP